MRPRFGWTTNVSGIHMDNPSGRPSYLPGYYRPVYPRAFYDQMVFAVWPLPFFMRLWRRRWLLESLLLSLNVMDMEQEGDRFETAYIVTPWRPRTHRRRPGGLRGFRFWWNHSLPAWFR